MKLNPRTMFILMIGSLGPLSSCSQHGAGSDEQNGAATHVPPFTKTSFDGCWNWYEQGKRVCKVAIARGQVASFQLLKRRSTPATQSTSTCAIDSQDGLITISGTQRAATDRWTTVTTLRFDLSDTPGRTCWAGLQAGVIAGLRTVEHNDPSDHFLFPPHEHERGLLIRCD